MCAKVECLVLWKEPVNVKHQDDYHLTHLNKLYNYTFYRALRDVLLLWPLSCSEVNLCSHLTICQKLELNMKLKQDNGYAPKTSA